jgi:preprotein translocase subunit SecG
MEVVVLSIHLLVCICLIGLVLLQRSEGGALGMGGGGGGSLMSGRGAADALAKMTQVAGGFFLVTSLGLTFIAGAGDANAGRSVLDSAPTEQSAPAIPTLPPASTTPDPTESSAPQAAETQLASAVTPGPAVAAASPATTPSATAARAAPIATPPSTTRSATTQPASTRPAQRPPAPTTTPATQPAPTRPLVIPNTSGAALTLDPAQIAPESGEAGSNGVEAVRRERAGPDQ